MKKFLFLTLALAFTTFGSQAFADTTIGIKKASDNTAKVSNFNTGKALGTVPIMFASGASWDNVRDSYTVTDATAAAISSKKVCFSVAETGTITFQTPSKKAACCKSCKKSKSKK